MNKFYLILISTLLFFSCEKTSHTQLPQQAQKSDLKEQEKDSLDAYSQKIVEAAYKVLNEKSTYDLSMAYYVTTYENGVDKGKAVYPNGDISPEISVCTDVVIRTFRYAELIDLQKALYEDIKQNPSSYNLKRWGISKADRNIDHRRVINLQSYFKEHWETIDEQSAKPGDVIIWDMNQDGASDHIGIVSENKSGENYKVIHCHPNPGYTAEENKFYLWKITGIYRYSIQAK